MQPIEDFDLIDKYLRNEMTPEEAKAFEQKVSQNETLKKELEIRYDIMVSIRASEQQHLLKELSKIDTQIARANSTTRYKSSTGTTPATNSTPKQSSNKIILIIALIILIILLSFAIWNVFCCIES